jgi:hypothetical protein
MDDLKNKKQCENEIFEFSRGIVGEILAAACAKLGGTPFVGPHEINLAADQLLKLVEESDREHRKKDQLKEKPLTTDREIIMARLARKIGRGRNAIYHGTRHLPAVLRMGKLLPSESGQKAVFFTRSPEIAAYWANMIGSEKDHYSGGILVLDRSTLTRTYRLEPSRYTKDWSDEREESIWGRPINFRRHLLGVVREADVDAILGPRKYRYLPNFCSPQHEKDSFWREALAPSGRLTRDDRAKVRQLIVRQREQPASGACSISQDCESNKVESCS